MLKNPYIRCCQTAEDNHYRHLADKDRENIRKIWKIFDPIMIPGKPERVIKSIILQLIFQSYTISTGQHSKIL